MSNAKDLPQTNYALLRMQNQLKEEKQAKNIIEKYRVINPKDYIDIEETINRLTKPK